MKISKEVKIGFIIITGIAIGLFGINYLKGTSLVTSHRKYYAVYNRVDGLKASNPININGFKVGQVADIDLMPDNSGRLIVTLSIHDRNLKVTRGSVAKIVSSDILGSKAVEFIIAPATMVHEVGDTIRSEVELGLKEVIAEEVDPIKAKFISLMSSLDTILLAFNTVLDEGAVDDLGTSIHSIRGAILSLERAALKLENLVASQSTNVNVTLTNARILSTTLADNAQKIDNVINNLSNVSDSIARANIGATFTRARETMENTSAIIQGINRGEGSAGLLLKTDSLHRQLVATTRSLENLFKDIQANPKRYVSFSVFGKSDKSVLTREEQQQLKEFINKDKK